MTYSTAYTIKRVTGGEYRHPRGLQRRPLVAGKLLDVGLLNACKMGNGDDIKPCKNLGRPLCGGTTGRSQDAGMNAQGLPPLFHTS